MMSGGTGNLAAGRSKAFERAIKKKRKKFPSKGRKENILLQALVHENVC